MADPNEHPALDRVTVDHALRLAPDKCPRPDQTEREIWMAAGARRLAEKLNAILFNQENNHLQT